MRDRGRWRYWSIIAVGFAVGGGGVSTLLHRLPIFEGALIAFLLPLTATVMYVSVTTILAKDASSGTDHALTNTYDHILFGVILFTVALHVILIAALVGVLPPGSWLARTPIVLFGLLAIWVGNLLPRTRPNLAIGIRTARTLWNRDAWMRTHRIAGHAESAIFGLRIVLAVFFVYAGVQKFPSDAHKMWPKIFGMIGFGQWFRYMTGGVEILGGLLLVLRPTVIIGAALLLCTMVGAILVHIFVIGVGPQTVAVTILLAGLVTIAVKHRSRSD